MNIYHYELKDWDDYLTGVLLLENGEWALLHELPADYRTDGFCLVNKQQVTDRFQDEDSDLKERVLQLKGYQPGLPRGLQLGELDEMLRSIEREYQLFGVQDEEEIIHIGTIQSIVGNELRLNLLNPSGEPANEPPAPIFKTDIQTVTFGTDYLDSIYLLWQHPSSIS